MTTRLDTCHLCYLRSKNWQTCYNCDRRWCNECNKELEAGGKKVLYPPELQGRVTYKCPYCDNKFMSGCKYMRPVKKDNCIIS